VRTRRKSRVSWKFQRK